jgi:hypothetical protein
VMAHELAHSWSGNLVTNASWDDAWLNEGFTTYLENRIVEALYGRDLAEMEVLLQVRALRATVAAEKNSPRKTQLFQDLTGSDPDAAGDVAYSKGSSFLRVLEKRFGRARLDAFLRRYFDANAFQPMTTAHFLEILKRDLFHDDAAAWRSVGVEEWVYSPGVPANIVVPPSAAFDRTRAAAAAFGRTGSTAGIERDWRTAEWLDFLNALEKPLTTARMAALDKACGLTERGNSEILFAWLEHVAASTYEPAYPALERFLTSQGRRKFLKPLYEDLQANPKTQALGIAIYRKARAGYHPIAVASIDALLKWPPGSDAMDFWLGEWDVFVAPHERAGFDRVEKVVAGGAIVESWTDADGSEGKGFFYFQPATGTWKQVWVQPGGYVKEKLSAPVENGLRFTGKVMLPDGREFPDRTTLTKNPDGSVHQVIEHSKDGGATWTVSFDAVYERRK